MSKLPTNFKDDIPDEEMNGKRLVKLTPLPDGTYIIEDVTKYIQIGSEYGQKEINQLNETVNGKIDSEKVIDNLNTALAVTEDGVPVGCKAISELNSRIEDIEQRMGGYTFYSPPLTEEEYQSIEPHDPNTIYPIKGDD